MNTADILIREYSRDYLERLFYFSLKKTGSQQGAEDLCSDISVQIIAALRKGVVPQNFPAWVFRIAKNRYRLWAIGKRRGNELFDSEAETEEIPDDTIGVEENLILGEDLKALRRELAFITADYRNLLVAYYIEDRSVGEVSKLLGVPEGTVKTKLFRARKKTERRIKYGKRIRTKEL